MSPPTLQGEHPKLSREEILHENAQRRRIRNGVCCCSANFEEAIEEDKINRLAAVRDIVEYLFR